MSNRTSDNGGITPSGRNNRLDDLRVSTSVPVGSSDQREETTAGRTRDVVQGNSALTKFTVHKMFQLDFLLVSFKISNLVYFFPRKLDYRSLCK